MRLREEGAGSLFGSVRISGLVSMETMKEIDQRERKELKNSNSLLGMTGG